MGGNLIAEDVPLRVSARAFVRMCVEKALTRTAWEARLLEDAALTARSLPKWQSGVFSSCHAFDVDHPGRRGEAHAVHET